MGERKEQTTIQPTNQENKEQNFRTPLNNNVNGLNSTIKRHTLTD